MRCTRRFSSVLASLTLTCLVQPTVSAQTTLKTLEGDSARDALGTSVAAAGDVNHDGHADVIVGSPGDSSGGANAGLVTIYSGRSLQPLHTFRGSNGERLGSAVAGVGDVNGDGTDDVVLGAPNQFLFGTKPGYAQVRSGRDGAILHTWTGSTAKGDQFGNAVAGAGDVNGDGYADVIVGASTLNFARVYSGKTGEVLYTLRGDSIADGFGTSVAGAGDTDGDGFDDVIVGAPGDDNNGSESGSARLFSGRTGAVLQTWNGDRAQDFFGTSVSGVGDATGDGKSEVIVGAPVNPGQNRAGYARVLAGGTWQAIRTWRVGSSLDRFGYSVAGCGDVDGDEVPDVIVGAYQQTFIQPTQAGFAQVFSIRANRLLRTLRGTTAGDHFGYSVSGAGDVNADGHPDVIVGAPKDANKGQDSGTARVVALRTTPFYGTFEIFGRPCESSQGALPRIGQQRRPRVGRTFDVTLRTAPASAPTVFRIGRSKYNIPLDGIGMPGCRLLLTPIVDFVLTTDAKGRARMTLPIPANNDIVGGSLSFQWYPLDAAANALGLIASNGSYIRIGN